MQVSVSRDQFTDDRPLSLVVLQSRDVRQMEACTGLCKVWLLSVMSCGLDFALPHAGPGPGVVRINPFCFQARHPTRQPNMGSVCYVITFCVSHRRRKMYCGHVRLCDCLSVCLSAAACLQYCMDPDVTWGSGGSCPLVVHYWADLQPVHRLRCYGNITRTLVYAGCARVAD